MANTSGKETRGSDRSSVVESRGKCRGMMSEIRLTKIDWWSGGLSCFGVLVCVTTCLIR